MARRIIWSTRSVDDLEEIAAFIAQDSEHYAQSVVRTIPRKTRTLSEFPFIGRVVPEFENESIREIFAFSYRIIYAVTEDEIHVLAVVHGRRMLDLSLKP